MAVYDSTCCFMWMEELGFFPPKGNIFKVSENVFLITYKSKKKENTRRLKKSEPRTAS